jgi:hypothetical protein
MRIATILREAALNIAVGTTRVALFAATLTVLMALLGGAEVVAVANIDHQAALFRQSGGSTLIYRMKGGIDGTACDSFRNHPGVSAAGAVRQREKGETPRALPTQEVPTFDTTPGFAGFQALGKPRAGDGILISEDLATTLGVKPGQRLPMAGDAPHVGGIFDYPADGRQPGYGYSILIPTDTRAPFDECWVEAWPVGEQLITLLPTTLTPGAASTGRAEPEGPRLQQLNASHGTRFEGEMLFANRITRFAPAVALLIGVALGFTATIRRKLELAAARHAGVTVSAQALQASIEAFVWAALGSIMAVPLLSVMIVAEDTPTPGSLGLLAARVIAAAAPATLIGAIIATLSIKERHLFAYFKSR